MVITFHAIGLSPTNSSIASTKEQNNATTCDQSGCLAACDLTHARSEERPCAQQLGYPACDLGYPACDLEALRRWHRWGGWGWACLGRARRLAVVGGRGVGVGGVGVGEVGEVAREVEEPHLAALLVEFDLLLDGVGDDRALLGGLLLHLLGHAREVAAPREVEEPHLAALLLVVDLLLDGVGDGRALLGGLLLHLLGHAS